MKLIKITLILLVFLIPTSSFAEEDFEELPPGGTAYKINFLPDGTEIKIEGKQIYYVCNHKLKPLPKGWYMLADGTVIKVKNGKITQDRHKYQRPTAKKSKRYEKKAAKEKEHKDEKLTPPSKQ